MLNHFFYILWINVTVIHEIFPRDSKKKLQGNTFAHGRAYIFRNGDKKKTVPLSRLTYIIIYTVVYYVLVNIIICSVLRIRWKCGGDMSFYRPHCYLIDSLPVSPVTASGEPVITGFHSDGPPIIRRCSLPCT